MLIFFVFTLLLICIAEQPRILADTYPNIRMTFNFDELNTSIQDAKLRDFVKSLVQSAEGFFEKRIKIKTPITSKIDMSQTYQQQCNSYPVPQNDLINGIVNSDYHFYVTAEDVNEEWMANAAYCVLDQSLSRPAAARLTFNLHHLKTYTNNQLKLWQDTAIHEMMHSLVFDSSLYGLFLKASDGQKYGNSATQKQQLRGLQTLILSTELLTQLARTFFNCQTAPGVQLENQGGEGSIDAHFERSIFYDEIMTSTRIGYSKAFTLFSFTLLQDSGWYEVDMRFPDSTPYGYKSGCSFLEKACQDTSSYHSEFCPIQQQIVCTPDFSSKGECQQSDKFSDGCPLVTWAINRECPDEADGQSDNTLQIFNQYYGLESRCFSSTLGGSQVGAQCYRHSCQDDGSIIIYYGTELLVCTQTGEELQIRGVDGTLICPDYDRFCLQRRKYCPGWCNNNGFCTGGICTCKSGKAGLDCSQSCPTGQYYDSTTKLCKEQCPSGTYGNSLNQSCMSCSAFCATCDEYKCIKCSDPYVVQDGICKGNCKGGYYSDSNKICQVCDSTCRTCYKIATQCTSCPVNIYLDGNTCVQDCPDGKFKNLPTMYCVATCPQFTYQDGQYCKKCETGTYLISKTCVPQCSDGYYGKSPEQACLQCDSSCGKCSGGSKYSCTYCLDPYYLTNNQCINVCPDGMFPNNQLRKCESCSFECMTCSSLDTCISCIDGYYQYEQKCQNFCPDGYYQDITQRKCDKCSSECKTCSSLQQCKSCAEGNFGLITNYGLKCYQQCPEGYWGNLTTCETCDIACKTCSGPSQSKCLQCATNYYKHDNLLCVFECPYLGYYGDKNDWQCKKCDANCHACVGPTSNDCTRCSKPQYLYEFTSNGLTEGLCVMKCPDKTRPNDFLERCIHQILLFYSFSIIYLFL